MKILVVEDDSRIATPIKEDLEQQNYVVDVAEDGEAALQISTAEDYDLILLDIMLPKVNGIEVCQTLRRRGFRGPVMILTASGSTRDKVIGLDCGADDYLVKPIDIEELGARVRALLRRNTSDRGAKISCAGLVLEQSACSITYKENALDLTPTEYRLLSNFMRHPQRTFKRSELIDKLWSSHDAPSEDVIKAHMKGLRQKLRQAGAPEDIIETVYGFGYRLKKNAGEN